MRINQKSFLIQRIAFMIIFIFSVVNPTFADSFSKYVGQSFILPIPKSPVRSGFVNSWSYSCSSTNISITNRGSSNPSEAVITKYFDGTLYIECYFQYIYYINNVPRTGTSTETHRVTCNSNNISISAPKSTLNVGESMQMTYRFSTSTFDATPQVTWQSNSSAVAINSYSGYVEAKSPGTATITARSNLGNNVAEYSIRVEKLDPTKIYITTTQSEVYCDEGLQLRASVSPPGASQSVTWTMIEGNSSIASLSSGGYLKGVSKGRVTVKATAENGISATKSISIIEPTFSFSSSSPSNNATGVSAFAKSSVTFSHDLYEGTNYSSVELKNAGDGGKIAGSVTRSGKTITFTPTKALVAQTNYTLTIPANAVKNKWGTHYTSAININFKTGDYEKLTLKSSVTDKFLSRGDKIALTASKSSAKIYYTLNGSTPTDNSTLYTGAITFENDIKLRAVAMGEGYESSEILSMDYYLTNVKVKGHYPNENTQLFVYEDVNPSLTFSNKIEPSDNINNLSVLKNGKDAIEGEVIVADSTIYFVPDEPLELGCYYKVSVPQNAIVTWLGEENDATSWTFNTGDFATAIAMGGEVSAAIKTDGSLLTWGEIFKSGNSADGSYVNETRQTPETFVTGDVAFVSAGYMHNAIIKSDGSLWMWGRQYCGEFGNNSTAGSASPVKVMDNVTEVSCGGQSSAIVKADGTLWMVGRNDFGQIGDSTVTVRKSPVKVMEDVQSAVAGWCSSYAIKADGSLMAWGRNDNGQLGDGTTDDRWEPTNVMTDVVVVSASQTESQMGAAIKTDGSLWIWGNGNPSPQMVLNDVSSVSTGTDYVVAVKNDGTIWKCSIDDSELMTESISDVAYNGSALIALKKDGSVWTGTGTNLSEKKVEGRSSSVLAGLTLNRSSMRIAEGTRSVLVAKPVVINADYSSLVWECSNEEVIEVSERGIITAKAIGETDVIVKIADDKGNSYTATCHINVVDPNGLDGINDILVQKHSLRAWANNNVLHITGLTVGTQVRVYDTNGSLLDSFVAESTEAERTIRGAGVYIIRNRNESAKVLNR